MICEDGLKRAREVEGLRMRKLPEHEASVGPTSPNLDVHYTAPELC